MGEGGRFKATKTKHPGVFFIKGTSHEGKPEKIFYISYYRDGKRHFEKAGRQYRDDMTASRASRIRGARIEGTELPNKARREEEAATKAAEAGRWTFDRLWAEWKAVNATKKGIANDDNRYRTHLQPLFGHKEPKEVTSFEVDRLRNLMLKGNAPSPGRKFNPSAMRRADYSEKKKKELAERAAKRERKREPYAVGTVVSVLSLLRRIASFGADRRLCDGLSFKVKTPKGAKQKTEDMTGDQMARYIRTCREWSDPREGNFQLLALYTGMRRSEIRKLKWADVDLDRGFILLRDPKSGEDERVPLGDAAAELLQAELKRTQRTADITLSSEETKGFALRPGKKVDLKGLGKRFNGAYGVPEVDHSIVNSSYIFSGEKGGPRGLRQIGESSRSIRDAAGLPADFRPNHGLRHTFASHLASSGEVDLYTLQRLMTHKSPIMTQRYAHLRDETLKRGANVMSRIVREANEKAREKGRDGIAEEGWVSGRKRGNFTGQLRGE